MNINDQKPTKSSRGLKATTNDNQTTKQILNVQNLNKFFVKSGKLVQVLDDIDFYVNEKDFFGIIGESGSGKSTTGKCMIRLYSSSSGIITFDDKIINQQPLRFCQKINYWFEQLASPTDPISVAMHKVNLRTYNHASKKDSKNWLYRNMSMIFQDPMSSLNPRKNVLSLVSEPLIINKTINKDACDVLNLYYETNPYFQNTYQLQDFNLTKKFLIPFYTKNIELFKEKIKIINSLNLDVNNINDLLNIINDLEFAYKDSLNELNSFVNSTKELVYENNKKLVNKKVHPTEIKYYETEKILNLEKKYLKYPQKYWQLCDILGKERQRLSDYVQHQKAIYEQQNLPKFKSILNSLKSEIKSMQQDAKLTSSITDHLFKKTDIFIKKDTYNALKEVIETYNAGTNAYFDIDKMHQFCDFISNKIKSKYQTLTKDTSKLVALSDKLDTLSIHETGQEAITAILTEYKTLYEQIETELAILEKTNFIEADLEVKQAIQAMVDQSFAIKTTITDEITKIQLVILDTIKAIDEVKKEHKKNQLETSPSFEQALHNFMVAKMERKVFVKQNNLEFKLNQKPIIKQQQIDIHDLDKQLYLLHKKFLSLTKTKQHDFIKLLQLNPTHHTPQNIFKDKLEHWLKAFNQQEQNKHNTIDIVKRNIKNSLIAISAINFEINNLIETYHLYKRLRTKNKFLLFLSKPSLKNIITREYVYNALDEVGLKNEHAYRYPHEFSGGQRQRIVIARALISKPKLIIADEPISALDVSIQAQVINIMKDLARKYNITFIFIAHDLSMVRYASNRLIIMHKGKIVEKGDTEEVFKNPIHPYTKSLIKASPELSKIHVDLASFSSKLDYDKNYSINNCPEFYSISEQYEHFVFATKEQIAKWKK